MPLPPNVRPNAGSKAMPLVPEAFDVTPILTSRLIQFFLMLFLLTALLHHQRDFTLFILLILGIAFGARLWSRLSGAHINADADIDRRKVFPGESVQMRIRLQNAKWLPIWLRVDLPADVLTSEGHTDSNPQESGLLWFQTLSLDWTLRPKKRGVYTLGPPRITVGDLMGFYPRTKQGGKAVQLLVFPRLLPMKSFPFPKRDYFGTPGSKSPVIDPVYILGTREYQSWRPARYIHWKASSRQNRLQEKIFEPSEQAKVLLLVEVEQFEHHKAETAFENTLELVASLAVQMNRQGYALGFITDGELNGIGSGMVPLAQNARQLPLILEMLARLRMKKAHPINGFFRKSLNATWGVSCARFAFRSDPADIHLKSRLKQRKIPFVSFLYEVDRPTPDSPGISEEPVYRIEDIRVSTPKNP